jgi:uncharacterized Zn finger protein
MAVTLEDALTEDVLYSLAGRRFYQRGVDYHIEGRVRSLVRKTEEIAAEIQGTEAYRVRLWVKDMDLAWECSCPLGEDGSFCKHCVAVGLTWLKGRSDDGPAPSSPETEDPELPEIRQYLSKCRKDELIDIVVQTAQGNGSLCERLRTAAAASGPRDEILKQLRKAVDRTIRIRGFVDYSRAHDYARKVDGFLDSLEGALLGGRAQEVVEIAEYAIESTEKSLDRIDDSDGIMGEILTRLEAIHLKACRIAKPAPRSLAKRLFEKALNGAWDTFLNAAENYADILGDDGLSEFRRLAEKKWARVPDLQPGRKERGLNQKRFRITTIMQSLAKASGDLKELIEVMSRDLSSPWRFLQIAEVLRDAGEDGQALEWAERGWKTFPGDPDPRLRSFLAEAYQKAGRQKEAIELVWQAYVNSPGSALYKDLEKYAEKSRGWSALKKEAIKRLRSGIEQSLAARTENSQSYGSDGSELVEIFLFEGDEEAAWKEANNLGCGERLWMRLALAREEKHPEQVIPVFKKAVESALGHKDKEGYREAVRLLKKIQGLITRIGRDEEFPPYLESVRTAHKRKRNFLKLLDRAKW